MANILIVDDSASMRQMIKFTLEIAGHKVTEATDGAQGLGLAKKNGYDLVISDVNMPNMNGIEMTTAIRELGTHKSMPILLLTTESGLDRKGEGKKAGATGWLVKPFDPEQLTKIVTKVLP
jgi:two-component system chemotaxis response regulator CheY